jgi:hypothetical protein
MVTKNEFETLCKKAIENKGNKVMLHSSECNEFRKTHEGCNGCQWELGCSQFVGLLFVSMDSNPIGKAETILEASNPKVIRTMDFEFSDYGTDYPDDYTGSNYMEDCDV